MFRKIPEICRRTWQSQCLADIQKWSLKREMGVRRYTLMLWVSIPRRLATCQPMRVKSLYTPKSLYTCNFNLDNKNKENHLNCDFEVRSSWCGPAPTKISWWILLSCFWINSQLCLINFRVKSSWLVATFVFGRILDFPPAASQVYKLFA